MALSEPRRRQLARSLSELRREGPIDNAQIERALVAVLEALLDDGGSRHPTGEDADFVLRGVDLGR
ncbi:hypothetical protein [Phenylobacterium sp.]|jgi:hypothetical protein|uniref:hypothetical protein n=1 Tax=Phenylobacterium sp. TaxID=1871053 RepID=UPI002E34BE32|nr:hypothetical protein [Phenylobacterium sp.]HEX4712975.1 hypothetical protein [Phenylobacterium sp.]